jgi:hypothetical protein
MSELHFRQLTADDFEAAYAIICEVTDWLLAKGIQQWVRPYPIEMYRERTNEGNNYGIFVGDELAVVASLMPTLPLYWGDYPAEAPFMWLSTLATAVKFKGHALGHIMLDRVAGYCAEQGIRNIYLDCAYGYLPGYYEAAGYQAVVRHQFNFPDVVFDAVLMRKTLNKGS